MEHVNIMLRIQMQLQTVSCYIYDNQYNNNFKIKHISYIYTHTE